MSYINLQGLVMQKLVKGPWIVIITL